MNAMDEDGTGSATANADPVPTFAGVRFSETRNALIGADGKVLTLRQQSLEVFRHLAASPGRIATKEEILAAVWPDVRVTDDSLVQCVSDIRRVLGDTERRVLENVPKRGYVMQPDPVGAAVGADGDANGGTRTAARSRPRAPRLAARAVAALVAGTVVVLSLFLLADRSGGEPDRTSATLADSEFANRTIGASATASGVPSLVIVPLGDALVADVMPDLRVALNRYRTLRLTNVADAELELRVEAAGGGASEPRVAVELRDVTTDMTVFAESYEALDTGRPLRDLGARIAAGVASPGVGAIDRHLIARTRTTPVESLTPAECYGYGFGCSKCSGEEDTVTRRAEACLAHVLERDPDDARALALQATIHAHRYWWGNTLPEPERSDPTLRRHMPALAVAAANRAEALSDGTDSSVYWGMAEAYFASCEVDKLATAIERGLAINPDDPNLLAAFGNWLSYSGRWDEGAAMTRRALEIEPRHARSWWWMGIAKTHYFKREFQAAHDAFVKSFNERNWLSHIQLAYTLPHLGRIDEARAAARAAEGLFGALTVEKVLETYRLLCFPDSFLADMREALTLAGLPSRGDATDLADIELPRAKIVNVDGIGTEYIDVGTGEPVVFVHGSFSDYRTWGYYLVPISESHRYVAYSRRYFGTQPWVDDGERWSTDVFAADLIAFIEALDLGPVHLVSWSSGVSTALIASVERPDLVRSMVHYEPVDHSVFDGDPDVGRLQEPFFALWPPVRTTLAAGDLEATVEGMLELVFSLGPGEHVTEREGILEIARQNARTLPLDLSFEDRGDTKLTCDYVSRVSVPSVYVAGSETLAYFRAMTERFAECTPGARLETLGGETHRGPLDAVTRLSALILETVAANR